jgi:hypothetical protein
VERDTQASEFVGEHLAFRAPFFQVGRSVFGLGGAGKDEIGDFQIADRAAEVRGIAVEFAAEKERGLSSFVGGAGIAEDGER